ncbi:MAG: thioredoxin family protein [Chthonomonadales bacterium]
MKKFLMSVTTVVAVAGSIIALNVSPTRAVVKESSAISWGSDLKKAMTTAAKSKKLILLDFGATWCGPCKQMLATTYKDKAVVAKVKTFVPVLIDIDKQPTVAQKYKVEAVPTMILVDAKGNVVKQTLGYSKAPEFLAFLNSAKAK